MNQLTCVSHRACLSFLFSLLHSLLSFIPPEVKRQKSVPEDLRKAEEDRGSPTELDIRRPFEEEVCPFFFSLIMLLFVEGC